MTAPQNPNPSPPPNGAQGEVKIEDLIMGKGVEVKMGDTVTMHYTGTLLDGTKFDSSHDHEGNKPLISMIPNTRLIQGWNRGIPGMKVGGKRRLTIPPALGYGGEAKAKIPPNSTLVFELELVDSKPTPQRPMPQHP
jgi:FKBP-type peptidyl-prolyl cis-trans isomerase